jgi:hypothetical protein
LAGVGAGKGNRWWRSLVDMRRGEGMCSGDWRRNLGKLFTQVQQRRVGVVVTIIERTHLSYSLCTGLLVLRVALGCQFDQLNMGYILQKYTTRNFRSYIL